MLSGFAISQVGEAHIVRGKGCEDNSACSCFRSLTLGSDIVVSIVADGVGSCSHASVGSGIAVYSLATFLERALQSMSFFTIIKAITKDSDEAVLKLIQHAFSYAVGKVEGHAYSDGNPLEAYDTTLTCALFDGSNAWWGHVGDDGIVALLDNGEFKMITRRQEGPDACSVVPLRERSSWEFGVVHNVTSLALMTDGMLDYCVSGAALGNLVNVSFLQPLMYSVIENPSSLDEARDSWEELLWGKPETSRAYGFRVRDKVSDDLTLVHASSSDAAQRLPVFDTALIDKYRSDLQERSQKLQASLRDAANSRFIEMSREGRTFGNVQRSCRDE